MFAFTGATWAIPSAGRRFLALFQENEYRFGLPPKLLARVAWRESRFKVDAKSSAGAIGIMQIVPKWHPDVDPTDPDEAIPYAAKYLRSLYDKFGTWSKALAAYNWGQGNLQKAIAAHGVNWLAATPKETQAYVAAITNDIKVI